MERMTRILLFSAVAVLGLPAAAHAEPISLSIALALSAALPGVAISVGAVSAVLYAGAAIAITAGSALLNSALNKQQQPDTGAAGAGVNRGLASINVETRAGVASREMVLGEVQKAGVICFEDVQGPYLYRMWVIAAHLIEDITAVKVNGNVVSLDANGFPIGPPFYDGTKYFLQISTRNGADDQEMCPVLAADWPTLERSFRQQGLACITAKLYRGANATEAESVWGQNDPKISVIVRGKKFFDPRDPTQDYNDAATFKWTPNAALCRAGWDHDAEGLGLLWTDEDLEALAMAADVSDEKILRRDGAYESRYECHGVINTSDDVSSVLQDLQLNMLGTFIGTADKVAYIAGSAREADATLTADSARGDLEANSGRSWDDVINTVRTSFSAKNDDYNVTDGPVYSDEDLMAEDGEEKSITISLPYTKSETQVQRICKYLIQLSRMGRTIGRGEDISGLLLVPGTIRRFAYDGALSLLNGEYMITRLADTDRIDEFTIEAQEFDGQRLFGWNAEIDERDWATSGAAA